MENVVCKGGPQRDALAIGLCFASGTLLGLEALRPASCAWLGFSADQTFALSANFSMVCMFLASYLLARSVGRNAPK